MATALRSMLHGGSLTRLAILVFSGALPAQHAAAEGQDTEQSRTPEAEPTPPAPSHSVPWSLIQPENPPELPAAPTLGFLSRTETPGPGELRLALPLRAEHAVKGFSTTGVGQGFGLEGESTVLDVSLAVGVARHLALFVVMPLGLSSKRSLSGTRYRESEPYTRSLDELRGRAALQLQNEGGVCFSKPACVALIAEGYAPQAGFSVDLGSDESVALQPGVPIDLVLDAVAVGEMLPAPGWSGPGDIQIGFKYEWVKFLPQRVRDSNLQSFEPPSPWGLALEVLGVLPTAEARAWSRTEDTPGAGTIDLGAALATDIELERNTTLAARYGAMFEVSKGRRARPSRLDGRRALGGPRPSFRRLGLGQSAALDLSYAMEGITSVLRPLAARLSYGVDIMRAERLGQEQVRSEYHLQTVSGELHFFSAAAGWPFSLAASLETPIFGSGEFIFLAPWRLGMSFEMVWPNTP